MKTLLSFQMSIFGTFSHFSATKENYDKVLTALGGKFLPSSIIGRDFDLQSGKVTQSARMSFINPDSGWNIVLLKDRIDLNFSKSDGLDSEIAIQVILQEGKEALGKVMKSLHISAGRIAVNYKYTVDNEKEKIERIRKKVASGVSYFNTKNIGEWSVHNDSIESVELNGVNEVTNIIVDISMFNKNPRDEPTQLIIGYDINTHQLNLTERFKINDISTFFTYANGIANLLDKSVSELFLGE